MIKMFDFPKLANLECLDEANITDGKPLTFDLGFEPKGNITFTYNEGVIILESKLINKY